MKTKELIKLLQEKDPSGETEVSIHNEDIYFIEKLPAFYDGCLQKLIIDEKKQPYYSVVGAKLISSGEKISIHTMGVIDAMYNDSKLNVDLSDISDFERERWEKKIQTERNKIMRMEELEKTVDKNGKYHTCTKEVFKKLKKVKLFLHVSRIQEARFKRWNAKLPKNRLKKVFSHSKIAHNGKSYSVYNYSKWDEPLRCPINLNILIKEYQNAKVPYSDYEKVPKMVLDIDGIDAMIENLYEWTKKIGFRER